MITLFSRHICLLLWYSNCMHVYPSVTTRFVSCTISILSKETKKWPNFGGKSLSLLLSLQDQGTNSWCWFFIALLAVLYQLQGFCNVVLKNCLQDNTNGKEQCNHLSPSPFSPLISNKVLPLLFFSFIPLQFVSFIVIIFSNKWLLRHAQTKKYTGWMVFNCYNFLHFLLCMCTLQTHQRGKEFLNELWNNCSSSIIYFLKTNPSTFVMYKR